MYSSSSLSVSVQKDAFLLISSKLPSLLRIPAGNAENLESANVKTVYCSPAQVEAFSATATSENGNYYQWSLLVTNLNYSQHWYVSLIVSYKRRMPEMTTRCWHDKAVNRVVIAGLLRRILNSVVS